MSNPKKTAKGEERHLRRILRLPKVEEITGKRRTAIYEEIAKGTFPAPIPLGLRAVGWLEDELAAWQDEQIAVRAQRLKHKEVELA
jgi:prophage regulatory protein